MSDTPRNSLDPPFTELKILKENTYKRVCLREDANGRIFVAKQYRGHKQEYSLSNCRYAIEVLGYFHQNFSGVARIPMPLGYDSDSQTIHLEYIADLTKARPLTQSTLSLADVFFEQCYKSTELNLFRSVADSIAYNDQIENWVVSGKKMSLGLKGDLWQNLCVLGSELIFADIDSAAIEPLGLSELVMRSEVAASLSFTNFIHRPGVDSLPVCFQYLVKEDAEKVASQALYSVESRMLHLPEVIASFKLRVARRALSLAIKLYYS